MRRSPTTIVLGVLAVSLNVAQAQNNGANVISALQNAGLDKLASALQTANGSQQGQGLLNQLSNQGNFTVFAPDDQAFNNPNVSSISNNSTALANVLAYHVLPGSFVNNTVNSSALDAGVLPNVTLGHTFLTNSSEVQLEGNKSQVLAWTRNSSDGQIYFLNQNPPVHVVNTTTISANGTNILVATIDGVLQPPSNTTTVLEQNNLTSLATLLNMVNVPASNGSNVTAAGLLDSNTTRGYTLFAPDNDALSKANSSLASLANNQTALQALLGNHYINGTSLYSPQITYLNSTEPSSLVSLISLFSASSYASFASSSNQFISAAGEPLSFSTNSSGTFVTSGNGASAKIVKTDLLAENGVIHVVDGVLANTQSDPQKASSAYASATSAAAQTSTQTGPIGPPTGTTTGSNNTTKDNHTNAALKATTGQDYLRLVLVVVGVFAGSAIFVGV
ncbi:hypothetical protein H0H93_012721 [Arthromyces matolae]|nr:hypothetical protein H0H93_012721 [Arthromyces matolae]